MRTLNRLNFLTYTDKKSCNCAKEVPVPKQTQNYLVEFLDRCDNVPHRYRLSKLYSTYPLVPSDFSPSCRPRGTQDWGLYLLSQEGVVSADMVQNDARRSPPQPLSLCSQTEAVDRLSLAWGISDCQVFILKNKSFNWIKL